MLVEPLGAERELVHVELAEHDPARAIQTTAVKDGDDWVVNGGKIFISGADRADYGIVFARTDAAVRRQLAELKLM